MDFFIYAERGIRRVFELNYPGHLLYFTTVAIGFTHREWRQFTALSFMFFSAFFCALFVSVYDAYDSDIWLVNFLIPICIVLTIFCNHIYLDYSTERLALYFHAFLACISGFIQGLSFSQRFAMSMVVEKNKLEELLGLTVGAQLSQTIITLVIFAITSFFLDRLRVTRLTYMALCSVVIMTGVIPMVLENNL